MSEPDDPGEARVRELLAELRASQPLAAALPAHVARTLRWQRPLRHTLEGIGALGAGAAAGLLGLLRGGRGR
jgi:hypothetical protein